MVKQYLFAKIVSNNHSPKVIPMTSHDSFRKVYENGMEQSLNDGI